MIPPPLSAANIERLLRFAQGVKPYASETCIEAHIERAVFEILLLRQVRDKLVAAHVNAEATHDRFERLMDRIESEESRADLAEAEVKRLRARLVAMGDNAQAPTQAPAQAPTP